MSTVRPILRVKDLSFSVGAATLVEGVSFDLHAGELVGLVGPNGAGKTTLIRLLAGLLKSGRGEVELDGRPLQTIDRRAVAATMATVPQLVELSIDLTALEYALFGRYPRLGRFEVEGRHDVEVARRSLATATVGPLEERELSTLSGGERQCVYLARGLAQEPRVLLVDEPTANLDLGHQLRVMQLLSRLAHDHGLAVLAALHDLALLGRYADRLLLVQHGRLIADGAPRDVLTPGNLDRAFDVRAEVRWDGADPVLVVHPVAVDSGPRESGIVADQGDAPIEDLSDEGLARKRAEQDAARQHPERRAQGIVIVNTGNGKGKTTAALGVLLRAWGRDLRVVMFQFIKAATANFGENRAAAKLGIEMTPLGSGFTWMSKDIEKDRALAQAGWEQARERLLAGTDDVVILDELTYLMKFDWIDVNEVIDVLSRRRPMQHVIITGRDAPDELVGYADLVTEMREIKHPYRSGIKAQPGIEF